MKHHFIYTLGLTALLLTFAACGDDRTGEYLTLTQEDHWIETQMKNYYLWYADMPKLDYEDYFDDEEDFFEDLLSTECRDGRGDTFSYFESTASSDTDNSLYVDEESTYGFDFAIYSDPTGTTAHYMARVLYVLPDSPASEAGLQRGDWITEIDSTYITTSTYSKLLEGGAISLGIADLVCTVEDDEEDWSWENETTLALSASRAVENNPFYCAEVISGTTIGYLMYDHFAPGATDSGTEYDEEMKEIFASFKSAGVTDFILDLRYNLGGTMSCIQQLCSYLAPSSALGQPLYYLEYNDKNTDLNSTAMLSEDLASQNLDLSTLYVITSSYTASASETTIYCLKPYMTVNILGETTVGKNLASLGFVSSYDFTIHPIVATVYSSENTTDFDYGIDPDYTCDELDDLNTLGEIGDADNELMLNYAVQWILNGSIEELASSSTIRSGSSKATRGTKKQSPLKTTVQYKKLRGNQITR